MASDGKNENLYNKYCKNEVTVTIELIEKICEKLIDTLWCYLVCVFWCLINYIHVYTSSLQDCGIFVRYKLQIPFYAFVGNLKVHKCTEKCDMHTTITRSNKCTSYSRLILKIYYSLQYLFGNILSV